MGALPANASVFAPADLLEALRIADVWEVFCELAAESRDDFTLWIEGAPDRAARWRRIDALVLALRLSPLIKDGAFERGASPLAWAGRRNLSHRRSR